MDILPEALGYNIRTARKRLGWGVRELGTRAGVSGATISRLEAGRISQETPEQLPGIAAALKRTIESLIRWPENPPVRMIRDGPSQHYETVAPARLVLLDRLGAEPAEPDDQEPEWAASANRHRHLFPHLEYQPARGALHPGRVRRVRVNGRCLEPQIRDGDVVYIDTFAAPEPDMIVLAEVDGALHLKRLRGRTDHDGFELVGNDGEPPIPVDPETEIAGAFVGLWRRELPPIE